MNKILLFLSLISISTFSVSQQIANTIWTTFNAGINESILVEISADSIRQTASLSGYLVSSAYSQTNDTVALRDYAGPYMCFPNTDTGWYRFSIVGDSMFISVLMDSCSQRAQAYEGQKLWRIYINVNSVESLIADLNLYPNPSTGKVNIELPEAGSIEVVNQSGQVVFTNNRVTDQLYKLNLSSGMYVMVFNGDKRRQTKRFIVH